MMVFIFFMWLKFLVYLKLTRAFGKMIKIIEIMIMDSVSFMIVFAIILVAFASFTSNFLSHSNPKYFGTLLVSIRSLLQFSYG